MKDILLAACGAFVMVNVIQFHVITGWRFKPFICDVCMAGWFYLILFFCPSWVDVSFYMAAAMIAARLINYVMKKTL